MAKETYLKNVRGFYFIVVTLITLSLIYAIIFSVYRENYLTLFVSIATLALVFLPFFIRRLKIALPTEIETVIVLFIYATLYLGEAHDFYFKYWWWDNLLHGFSAIVFGFIGFTVLYFMVNRHELNAKPWALAIFSFSFAIAVGALWEIFEFSLDTFFNLNTQKSGLPDTMGDLIVDAIGALLSSAIAFVYLKTKKRLIFKGIAKRTKIKK